MRCPCSPSSPSSTARADPALRSIGSYVVNYSLINAHLPRTLSVPSSESPFAPSTSSTAVSQKSITTGAPAVPASPDPGFYHPESPTVVQTPRTSTVEPMDVDQPSQLLDVVEAQGIKGLTSDSAHKQFNRLLLEHVSHLFRACTARLRLVRFTNPRWNVRSATTLCMSSRSRVLSSTFRLPLVNCWSTSLPSSLVRRSRRSATRATSSRSFAN